MHAAHEASITIDVDSLRCYREIHGLPPREDVRDPIFTVALPRFLALLERLSAQGTLFVVGRDLEQAKPGGELHRSAVAEAARAGHELASHSYAHDYRMSLWSYAQITADLARCEDAITAICGKRPRGFRAPGYNQSETLFDALEALGYAYDSSFFPTPAYYAARGAALLAYRARGRGSRSLLGDVREFVAPRGPFFPSRQARHRSALPREDARRVLEIPIGVATGLRLPWLGTSLAMLPDRAGEWMTRSALQTPGPCILELHAIDFLDESDVQDAGLVASQPDLRVRYAEKERRLWSTLRRMAEERAILPLATLAERHGASPDVASERPAAA